MTEEEKKYIEYFRQQNENAAAGVTEPKKELSPEAKTLRVIALLIFGAIVIYLFTAKIW